MFSFLVKHTKEVKQLTSEVGELRTGLAALKDQFVEIVKGIKEYSERIEAESEVTKNELTEAKKECEDLLSAMKLFGGHLPGCATQNWDLVDYGNPTGVPCSCGLDQVLKKE